MAEPDFELVRKIARLTALALGPFDPVFCSKVVRIAAAVSAVVFLLTVALAMLWVPADSGCHSSVAPEPIHVFLFLSGAPALWLCILAIFWKPLAASISERDSAYPKWLLPREWTGPAFTALFTAVFAGFVAASALPFVDILQEC